MYKQIANQDEPFDVTRNKEAFFRHLLWACDRIPEVIDKMGGFLFCMRYLGIEFLDTTGFSKIAAAEA
jgi:hypothetical protein